MFAWIPSHVGIRGNEQVDDLAKKASSLLLGSTTNTLPQTDFRNKVKKYTSSLWESHWEKQKNNKLYVIKPKLKQRNPSDLSRRDEVIFTRLRIGHTALTHKYLLQGDEKPFCVGCDTDFTIRHILTECLDFGEIRRKYYKCKKLQDIFSVVGPSKILNFMKAIGLYGKL